MSIIIFLFLFAKVITLKRLICLSSDDDDDDDDLHSDVDDDDDDEDDDGGFNISILTFSVAFKN